MNSYVYRCVRGGAAAEGGGHSLGDWCTQAVLARTARSALYRRTLPRAAASLGIRTGKRISIIEIGDS